MSQSSVDGICKCEVKPSGRKLVIAFDGTSNQFGPKNTNVVELYARVEKSEEQLTYYNSGIGTYADPTHKWNWTYLKMVLDNTIDLAIAWNFERIILAGYRWLSENFKPGDQIFLFGFSRGAYQVRTLAGMIEKVGLIYAGNEEQIPFAYELYTKYASDAEGTSTATPGRKDMAKRFKDTFSRPSVRVHFVGIWDCVSSVGIIRSKNLPLTDTCSHICYIRHALALDERRVKFMPECIFPQKSPTEIHTNDKPSAVEKPLSKKEAQGVAKPNPPDQSAHNPRAHGSKDYEDVKKEDSSGNVARRSKSEHIKEVWFAGSHSDIGGGNKINEELNMNDVPALWMANEAMMAGLKLKPSDVDGWKLEDLRTDKPTESLRHVWWILEILPLKRPRRHNSLDTTSKPHCGKGRMIVQGQKIHASIAFKHNYTPKTTFSKDYQFSKDQWDQIVGCGKPDNIDWAKYIPKEILEMDLYDCTAGGILIIQLGEALAEGAGQQNTVQLLLERLNCIAAFKPGVKSIVEEKSWSQVLIKVLNSNVPVESKHRTLEVITRICCQRSALKTLWKSAIPPRLFKAADDPEPKLQYLAKKAIVQLYRPFYRQLPEYDYKKYSTQLVDIISESSKFDDPLPGAQALKQIFEDNEIQAILLKGEVLKDYIFKLVDMLNDWSVPRQKAGMRALNTLSIYGDVRDIIHETPTIHILLKTSRVEYSVMLHSVIAELLESSKHDNLFPSTTSTGTNSWYKKARKLKLFHKDHVAANQGPIPWLKSHNISIEEIMEKIPETINIDNSPTTQASLIRDSLSKLKQSGVLEPENQISKFLCDLIAKLKDEHSKVRGCTVDLLNVLAEYDLTCAQIVDSDLQQWLLPAVIEHDDISHRYYRLLTKLTKNGILAVPLQKIIQIIIRKIRESNLCDFCRSYNVDLLEVLILEAESRAALLKDGFMTSLAEASKSGAQFVDYEYYRLFLALLGHDDTIRSIADTEIISTLVKYLHDATSDKTYCGRLISKMAGHSTLLEVILKFESDIFQSIGTKLKHKDAPSPDQIVVLSGLARHDDSRKKIIHLGILQALARKPRLNYYSLLLELAKHDDSSLLVFQEDFLGLPSHDESNHDLNSMHDVYQFLLLAAETESTRQKMVKAKVLESLDYISEKCETCLWYRQYYLLCGKLLEQENLRSTMATTSIMRSLANGPKKPFVDIYDSLSGLIRLDDIRTTLLDNNLIGSVENASRTLHYKCLSWTSYREFLIVLAEYDDARERLLQSQIIQTLAARTKKYGTDSYYESLSALAEHADLRDQLLKTDILNTLAHQSEDLSDEQQRLLDILKPASEAQAMSSPDDQDAGAQLSDINLPEAARTSLEVDTQAPTVVRNDESSSPDVLSYTSATAPAPDSPMLA